jgi:hypothetical protein
MLLLVFLVLLVLLLLALRASAKRFEVEQREKGRWDEYGPLIETEPPPLGMRGTRMSWRLEVIGRWIPRVVRRRRPHEK